MGPDQVQVLAKTWPKLGLDPTQLAKYKITKKLPLSLSLYIYQSLTQNSFLFFLSKLSRLSPFSLNSAASLISLASHPALIDSHSHSHSEEHVIVRSERDLVVWVLQFFFFLGSKIVLLFLSFMSQYIILIFLRWIKDSDFPLNYWAILGPSCLFLLSSQKPLLRSTWGCC